MTKAQGRPVEQRPEESEGAMVQEADVEQSEDTEASENRRYKRGAFASLPGGLLLFVCLFLPSFEACSVKTVPLELGKEAVLVFGFGLLVAFVALARLVSRGPLFRAGVVLLFLAGLLPALPAGVILHTELYKVKGFDSFVSLAAAMALWWSFVPLLAYTARPRVSWDWRYARIQWVISLLYVLSFGWVALAFKPLRGLWLSLLASCVLFASGAWMARVAREKRVGIGHVLVGIGLVIAFLQISYVRRVLIPARVDRLAKTVASMKPAGKAFQNEALHSALRKAIRDFGQYKRFARRAGASTVLEQAWRAKSYKVRRDVLRARAKILLLKHLLPFLRKAAKDPHVEVQREAFRQLGALASRAKGTTRLLLTGLQSSDHWVRWAAMGALRKIDPYFAHNKIEPWLLRLHLRENVGLRGALASTLERKKKTLPQLAPLLRHWHALVREAAVKQLARFAGQKEALSYARRAHKDPHALVRAAAATALATLQPKTREKDAKAKAAPPAARTPDKSPNPPQTRLFSTEPGPR